MLVFANAHTFVLEVRVQYTIIILIGQNDNLREVKYEPYPTFALWDVKYGSHSLPVS